MSELPKPTAGQDTTQSVPTDLPTKSKKQRSKRIVQDEVPEVAQAPVDPPYHEIDTDMRDAMDLTEADNDTAEGPVAAAEATKPPTPCKRCQDAEGQVVFHNAKNCPVLKASKKAGQKEKKKEKRKAVDDGQGAVNKKSKPNKTGPSKDKEEVTGEKQEQKKKKKKAGEGKGPADKPTAKPSAKPEASQPAVTATRREQNGGNDTNTPIADGNCIVLVLPAGTTMAEVDVVNAVAAAGIKPLRVDFLRGTTWVLRLLSADVVKEAIAAKTVTLPGGSKASLRAYLPGGPKAFFTEKSGFYSNEQLIGMLAARFPERKFWIGTKMTQAVQLSAKLVIFEEETKMNAFELTAAEGYTFTVYFRAVSRADRCSMCGEGHKTWICPMMVAIAGGGMANQLRDKPSV